ncbi:MAG TPA: hypothetical protein VHE30_08760 [Polyangiaceae bacterium]|nr:hypothetical protein [Polyangiaceae bacterium]
MIALSALLMATSLPAGLAADDFIHEVALEAKGAVPGFSRAPLDLFRFATPDCSASLQADGVLPWWIDPTVRFAFFRPLSAATHVFDHALFPGNGFLAHVHTWAWAILALLAIRSLYRAVHPVGWVAPLALCLYALDDARGSPVAWVANRNELVACTLSVYALGLYLRGRAGNRTAGLVAPLVFAASLLANEGSMAVTGYLFAHVLFVEEGPLVRRFLRLWPFAVVVVIWAALYRGVGYGISGSGVYFDPLRDPVDFLRVLPERFAMLWLAQLGGPWSEGWNAYPFMFPGLEYVVAFLAVVALVGAGFLFAPVLRRSAEARFWALGAVIATFPACGAFPADRLLPWIGIGGMALTAQFFAGFVDSPEPGGLRGAIERLGAIAAVGTHLVIGPLLLPVRSFGIAQVRAAIDRADMSIPSDAAVANRTVIFWNPPADPFASYIPVTRAARHVTRPKTLRWVATGETAVHVTRVDARTVLVKPDRGYLLLPSEKLFRNTARHPFTVGQVIQVPEMQVTIRAVTSDGRPETAEIRFDHPLEDPGYLFMAWIGGGYTPFPAPALGSEMTIPAVDLVTVAYGPDSSVTKMLRPPVKVPSERR